MEYLGRRTFKLMGFYLIIWSLAMIGVGIYWLFNHIFNAIF